MVTGNLKYRILIAIDISKDLAYYADSQYIQFTKFIAPRKLQIWQKFAWYLKKGETSPKSHGTLKTTQSDSVYPRTPL